MLGKHRHLLVEYLMFYWLYNNNKFGLILYFNLNNYFLIREFNKFKFRISQDSLSKKILLILLKHRDCLVALHGLYLLPIIPKFKDIDVSERLY